MSDVTVKQLANVLALPVDKLLVQLAEAGMKFSGPDQIVTSTEKVKLLGFLRRTHGKKETPVEEDAGPKQITLRRKKVSELTVSSGAAKGKTVNVEVRQKRTYVKRSVMSDDQPTDAATAERDEALRLLARRGLPVPATHTDRDWTLPYAASDEVEAAWLTVYRAPETHWDLYQLGEELTDLEDAFRLWRFRHVTTVERIIGFKRGTGGTGGVSYLRKMLDVVLFPEIWKLRTDL